ncbi:small metal-binding protein SmbP [Methyloglobulus sp.]|uniref:small metal-binding protein SmbP n=1 Tax=Methyloglobulus sp. TaxID=2518622 RepID=UPI0039890652
MSKKFLSIGISTILATCLFSGLAFAKEEHTSAALEHATAAAAATDATGVSAHATEALKHTGPAKTAHAPHPDVVKHIEEGEVHLKAAVDTASKGDAASAAQHASVAKTHLEAADK